MSQSKRLNNHQIAEFFTKVADLMRLLGENHFKIRAYRRAADTIKGLPRDIYLDHEAGTLKKISGIGKAIAEKISEIIETGRLEYLERLQAKVPAGVAEMMKVPDVGPKSAMTIYNRLGIQSIQELEVAAEMGRLRTIKGFGAKTEQRILAGIQALRKRSTRSLLGVAWPRAEALLATLREEIGTHILQADLAGSLRRGRATIGDLDLLVAAETAHAAAIMKAFQTLPQVSEIIAAGESKSAVRLHTGEQVDLRVVQQKHWGCALQYFTGSQQHNIQMRRLARLAGLSLNEYRFLSDAGEEFFCPSEEEVYQKLGLPWIAPELREDQGEIDAAQADDLPNLIERSHLRGDLHMHSTWSDGKSSILQMAEAARALGHEYIVITDHSQSLAMTGGLNVERLMQQRYEIININAKFNDFAVLQGSEVEIKADGSLDYPDEVLEKLDVVVASMHTGIRGERETLTKRMLSAIHNPHVDVIGHLTNRLLGRREGADIDMDAILRAAAETGTILEINSQPDRLDLDATHARQLLEYGGLLAINSDAHTTDGLNNVRYGIKQARRAWADADDVMNTRGLEEFLSYIGGE